jgi:hypothetical protein
MWMSESERARTAVQAERVGLPDGPLISMEKIQKIVEQDRKFSSNSTPQKFVTLKCLLF